MLAFAGAGPSSPAGPAHSAYARALEAGFRADEPVAAFYRAHGLRPLWTGDARARREARALVGLFASASADGLNPARYRPARLAALLAAAEDERPEDIAAAELALSRAYAAYVRDLRTPAPYARLAFVDPALEPPVPTAAAILAEAARRPDARARVAAARRMNPIYQRLRAALAADPASAALRLNLERARALPPDLGRRHILVDAPSQTLTLVEDGRATLTMPVAVGSEADETPAMAGLLRYAVFDPYWNVPDDVARERFAEPAARWGWPVIEGAGMEVWSDWTRSARRLDPAAVDWAAVADGRRTVRLRQRPGPRNTMGSVKFMLPNRLGIYLHDTPDKSVFARRRRMVSAGCIRLADAAALARALFGATPATGGGVERRVDLAEPVPVYVTYFTAFPLDDGRVETRPDVYGRDREALASLTADVRPA